MPSTRRHFLSSTAGTLLGVPFLGAMTGNETAAGSQPSGIAQSGAPSTAKRTTGKKPAPARRLDTGLFLDVEDIFSPPELGNDDSIKELATILTEEGLRANFMVIADRALLLKQRGRRDVIDSLEPHEVGVHTRTLAKSQRTQSVSNRLMIFATRGKELIMPRSVICRSVLSVFLPLLSGVVISAAPPTGMKVWVVGDSTRIDPTKNTAFEDNPLLFPDSLSGNYQESNLIWDGQHRLISLRTARNESVAFQIVVERTGSEKMSHGGVPRQRAPSLPAPGFRPLISRCILAGYPGRPISMR